jgi:hypothetical protein
MQKYYIIKNGVSNSTKNYTTNTYNSLEFGTQITSSYPLTSSISFDLIVSPSDNNRSKLKSLKTSLKNYVGYSKYFEYKNSFQDFDNDTINLISIPSIFYGSAIKKGSVELSFNITGSSIGKLQDIKQNGELIQTSGINSGSVAGIVLYNEGFIILKGSWDLDQNYIETYAGTSDYPKWIYFGNDLFSGSVASDYSSYNLSFNGTHKIPTLTMFLDAEKGEFNHSNNPTFLNNNFNSSLVQVSDTSIFKENELVEIKNIVQSPFSGSQSNFQKETYISYIEIYDKDKNVIAIAKLAKPVRKIENREITFKLKLDL